MSTPELRHQFTNAQRYYADFMIDVLVYTVVLNLFVEWVDSIVSPVYVASRETRFGPHAYRADSG